MSRKSGVLMHISSLFGDYSIGGFGKEAKYFIDFLCRCGFSYWQVLPFCPSDECNSPYKSPSSFAGNPYFISLEKLMEKGLLTSEEVSSQKQSTPYLCEYRRLYEQRVPILKKAAKRVSNEERARVEAFAAKNPYLLNFCKFMSIKEENGNLPWNKWKNESFNEESFFAWKFIQYEFFTQWSEIKAYANERGIKIIGDIPFYVDFDSSDVWADKHLFKLDEKNMPVSVAGVPPDYFSEDGQLWGNPIYNWEAMKSESYRWWRNRISHMAQMFDGIRIDHFRAIESYWEIPADAESAKSGKMMKGPGKELIDAIKEESNGSIIIAEDLGLITPEVEKLVKESGFPGMRVFQFAFMGDTESVHLPHNYPKNSVVYTGTHDNNTLLGYLWELDDSSRRRMLKYCGFDGNDWGGGCEYIIRTMMASHSDTFIMPIQDLLGYGSDTRLNTPGKTDGNWAYRITKEQLDSIDTEKFKSLNSLYSRI